MGMWTIRVNSPDSEMSCIAAFVTSQHFWCFAQTE